MEQRNVLAQNWNSDICEIQSSYIFSRPICSQHIK